MTMESAIAKEKTWQSTITSAEKKTTSLGPIKETRRKKKDVEMTAAEENPKDVRSSDKEETAITDGVLNPAQDN